MRPLLLLLPILGLIPDGVINLKHVRQVGETEKYQATVIFDLYGSSVVYKSTLTQKVLSVEKDGTYSTESSQADISALNADRDMPVDTKGVPLITIYNPNGQVNQLKENESTDAFKIAVLGQFCYPDKPVAPNDTWTVKVAPNLDRDLNEIDATYKLVGPQKLGDVDTILVTEEVKENVISNPVSATMKFWLDPKTYIVQKADGDWRNAPLLGASTVVNAHVSYVLAP